MTFRIDEVMRYRAQPWKSSRQKDTAASAFLGLVVRRGLVVRGLVVRRDWYFGKNRGC
jgi:hypothetical protein